MKIAKEFLIGLTFLLAVGVLGIVGFLLFPLVVVLAWFMRVVVILLFGLAAVWLLGKFIVYVWESVKGSGESSGAVSGKGDRI